MACVTLRTSLRVAFYTTLVCWFLAYSNVSLILLLQCDNCNSDALCCDSQHFNIIDLYLPSWSRFLGWYSVASLSSSTSVPLRVCTCTMSYIFCTEIPFSGLPVKWHCKSVFPVLHNLRQRKRWELYQFFLDNCLALKLYLIFWDNVICLYKVPFMQTIVAAPRTQQTWIPWHCLGWSSSGRWMNSNTFGNKHFWPGASLGAAYRLGGSCSPPATGFPPQVFVADFFLVFSSLLIFPFSTLCCWFWFWFWFRQRNAASLGFLGFLSLLWWLWRRLWGLPLLPLILEKSTM